MKRLGDFLENMGKKWDFVFFFYSFILVKVIVYGFDPMVNHQPPFGEYDDFFPTTKQANLSFGVNGDSRWEG